MQTVNISANIPASLSQKLKKVCAIEERAQSFYIRKALEEYLTKKLEDIQDYQDAKKAHEEFIASGEEAIPYEEIRKKYKL